MSDSSFILADQRVLDNKKELEELKAKLDTILLIVGKYKNDGGLGAINHRIENFCECVASSCISVIFHIRPCFPVPSSSN